MTRDTDDRERGDTKTFTFTITDPDADTWSFATGYPKCGDNASLVSAPCITVGHVPVHVPDGPSNSTVAVKVDDGTADSNEATNAVAVSNVKPTVTIASVSGNSGTACIDGNEVTLEFSWTDPGRHERRVLVHGQLGSRHEHHGLERDIAGERPDAYLSGRWAVHDPGDGQRRRPGDPGSASSAAFSFLYSTSGSSSR